jgi:serine/threonine protein kinase
MSVDLTKDSDRDQRFHAIVLSCLEALDSSRKPARDELLARFPEFAAELTKFLDDQERVDGLAVPLRQAIQANRPNHGSPAPGEYTAPRELGDFLILREVGRGGMGIVYEAEQMSLGRRVALKVLPFAATMDSRHLQRFQNEARAAASLEHPHIVPVYGVGCERGVHYYAMKFIDGQSLAEVIAAQRPSEPRTQRSEVSGGDGPLTPLRSVRGSESTSPIAALITQRAPRDAAAFRQIADWGIQAAEALEHAHSLGIVHRDIKPANLLIEDCRLPTANCPLRLWITDFGLARTAADAGLTMTGDVLGTLRYMSPEQALAKHGLVDHRTDIYSLGVTLYELLTGTPAITGNGREEILNRITLEDSQPPRSFDPTIPRDLETIVLKTMAKNPLERYSTARELADDLRRHLDSQPIRARRASLAQRFTKWSRRHRHFVTATFLVVVLAAIGLAVGTYLLWQEGLKTQAALDQAKEQRQAAVEQSARVLAEQRHAEMNFDMAMNGVNIMLGPLYAMDRVETPQLHELRRVLTEKAIRFYQSLDSEGIDDRMVRYRTARAYNSLAVLYDITGDRSKALEFRLKAVARFETLTKDYQKDASFWNQRGHTHNRLSMHLLEMNEPTKAAEQLQMAAYAFEQACLLEPSDPRYPNNLATVLVNSNDPLDRSNPKAVEFARKARDLEPGFKDSWNILGAALYYAGDWKAAAEVLNTSLQMKKPTILTYRVDGEDCFCRFFLAMAQGKLNRTTQARQNYDLAVKWVNENVPDAIYWLRLRDQAAEVLDIKDSPKPSGVRDSRGR